MRKWIAGVFSAAVLAAVPAAAEPPTDTVANVKETGTFTIGFREDARPFSFRDDQGEPAGYSVDLCRKVAAQVKERAGVSDINLRYVPVLADGRVKALESGDIDIECGASSETLERRERVDFSLQTFVTGAEMLVATDSGIADFGDLDGKKVGVLAGTTTEEGLRAALEEDAVDAEVVTFDRHEEGLAALENGSIDAYFADRILLLGLGAKAKDPSKLQLSGRFYSYEPYALMMRRGDEELRLAADTALASLYRTGEAWDIYKTYFGEAEPSELLTALYILGGIPVE